MEELTVALAAAKEQHIVGRKMSSVGKGCLR